MSWKKGSNSGRSKRGGWSGGGATREKPLHRWQDSAAATDAGRARAGPTRSRWLAVTGMAAALLCLFVYMLLRAWYPTPLVVITATEYESPIPANAWAREDRESFKKLNRDKVTLYDKSNEWNESPSARTSFLPEDFNPRPSRDGEPLILYISMHGIVDDKGRACLIPPGTSIHNPAGWRTLDRILDEIKKKVLDVAPSRKVLLVLDCQRIRANWSLGVVYNSFAERLADLKLDRNVAVLASAGAGQVGWASPELRGSAFGRYFALGLAGAADSDENEEVSLRELSQYLAREVAAWARFNRGEPQTPLLLAEDGADFRLTRVHQGALEAIQADFASTEQQPAVAVTPEDLEALWSQFDELRESDIVRYDPVAFRDFEHELLRVVELSQAGAAYADNAKKRAASLRERLSTAIDRARQAQDSGALAAHLRITSEKPWATITAANHSLPASEYFGACDAAQANQIEALWQPLIAGGSLSKAIENDQPAGKLFETQLLVAARQNNIGSLWPSKANILADLALQRNVAEAMAVPRDENGATGDERAHTYVRYALDVADAERRFAEDLLFIGELDAPKEHDYESRSKEADRLYDWARSIRSDASAAFAANDTAFARAPYLAAWVCNPLADGIPFRSKNISDQVSRLIDNTHQLGMEINRPEKFRSQAELPKDGERLFFELTGQVQADLAALEKEFKLIVKDLAGGGAQRASGWRAIEATLAMPLLTADVRSELVAIQSAIAADLHAKFFKNETTGGGEPQTADSSEAADDASYLERLGIWKAHPLLAILEVSSPSTGTSESGLPWYETAATQARSKLSAIPAKALATSKPDGDSQTGAIARERQRLSQAEHKLRAAAAIDFDTSDAADPISALRRFDLQQLLVWLAQRSLDDFWGDVPSDADRDSFFAVAASDYLAAARKLSSEATPPPVLEQQLERMEALLDERRKAKRNSVAIKPDPPELLDETSGSVAVSIAVDYMSEAYPPGLSALYLADEEGRLAGDLVDRSQPNAKAFVSLPSNSAEPKCHFMLPSTARFGGKLNAVSFFRGRSQTAEVALPVFQGVVVEYSPQLYDRQSILLTGEGLAPSAIEFILDCSHSMTDEVDLEGGRRAQRMVPAKSALLQMLTDLASRNQSGAESTLVGVRFFGHRVGWVPEVTPPQLVVQPKYERLIPRGLRPSRDVEKIQPVGRFDLTTLEGVKSELDKVQPWGETPLFLTLVEALGDFEGVPRNTQKSIIAITDGKNEQFEPTTSLEDVMREVRRRPDVRIFIVGFDIVANEAQTAKREYEAIAEASGGRYFPVRSYTELLKALRDQLARGGYLVRKENGEPVNRIENREPMLERLNTPVEIPNTIPLPQDFWVEYQRAERKAVRVEGGEALTLRAQQSESAQEIVANPYRAAGIARTVLLEGEPQPIHRLYVHTPLREKNNVSFTFALQVDPQVFHFTERPLETWIEVTPVGAASGASAAGPYPTYFFYDRNFERQTAVPVLKWDALDWPVDASRAEIRFWCKYGEPTAPISELSLRSAEFGKAQPVPGIDGASLTINRPTQSGGHYRIYVVEQHGPLSPGVGSVRVHCEADLKPSRVRHQFDRNIGRAAHTFEFRVDNPEQVRQLANARIVVIAAADVKNAALHTPADPRLQVEIGDASGLHSVTRDGARELPSSTGSQP